MVDIKVGQEEGFEEIKQSKGPSTVADAERFKSLMEPAQAEEMKVDNLMDLVHNLNTNRMPPGTVPPDALAAQAHDIAEHIGEIKQALDSPEIKEKAAALSPELRSQLYDKLSHVNDNVRIALSKAGIEHSAEATPSGERINPIKQFINLLSDGQESLGRLGNELVTTSKDLSPANMLAIEIKVHQIQQELELFTNVLSKALEGFKTLMNVQV